MPDQVREESNPQKVKKITSPEILVLVVLLVFGSFLAFRVPLGAGFDEETHLLRVWEMSTFNWLPNSRLGKNLQFPAIFWNLSYRRQAILEPVALDFWNDYGNIPIDGLGYVEETLTTRSVYSPLLLLPQSLLMFILGEMFHLPALTTLIAIRMAGLLIYTLMVWLAVRLVPFGKWTWAILVLAPMAVYQAATVNTDTISNGIGFLFVSCCLLITTRSEIHWKEWVYLLLLFTLLFMAKVNMVILAFLPFIIIPPARFKMKAGFLLLIITTIFLAMSEVLGWNFIAYSRFYTAIPGANPAAQLTHLITHPFASSWIIISDLGIHIFAYIRGWIADYGYGYWGAPWIVFPLYLLALGATYFINGDNKPAGRTQIGLFTVFVLSFLATLLSLYVFYNRVGNPDIQEVHGRYFTVIFPLLFLGLVGLNFKTGLNRSLIMHSTIVITVLCLLFYSIGMYLGFYVRCGTSLYKPGLCYQPVYKNWAPNAQYFKPLSSSQTLTQWFIPKCNGMRSVRIWIDATDSNPEGKTNFIIIDESNDIIILSSDIQNSNLPEKGWLTLSFPGDNQSGGKWYTLLAEDVDSRPGQGIRIASSIQAEYVDAPLVDNKTEIDKDMIFQYGCTAGWQKLIPNIVSLVIKQLNR